MSEFCEVCSFRARQRFALDRQWLSMPEFDELIDWTRAHEAVHGDRGVDHWPGWQWFIGVSPPILSGPHLDVPGLVRDRLEQRRAGAKRRRPVSNHRRWAVHDRDGYVCLACGTREDLTIDHIVPVSAGGTNDLDNLQTLCRSCNSRKGTKTETPSLNGGARLES